MGMLLKSCKPFYWHYFRMIKYASLVIVLLIFLLPLYFGLGIDLGTLLALAGAYLLLALASSLYIKFVNDAIVYTATDSEITKDEGVIQKKHTVVPYSKVSNMVVKRGLLDRFFNLCTIKIDATGGGHEYEITMDRLKLKDANAMMEIIKDLLAQHEPQQGPSNMPPSEPTAAEKKEEAAEERKPKPELLPRLYALGDMGKDKLEELEHMAYSRQSDAGADDETRAPEKTKRQKQAKGGNGKEKRK
ncbi:MAG: PH domain-containing protein [Candidatus Burarchaeum sp.]|nr:PH domain-containing protein [Candidatus Burarchaeum sp.]MDO8339158.1 PH domain-containing protein [Candidatus Burarchaeum sp.]